MIKTKKEILRLFFFFLILCFGILNVEAESIDVSRTSSLTLTYQYENEKFSNINVSLYQLAIFDTTGQYQFNNTYIDIAFDSSGMSTSDLSLKAIEIEKFISENNQQPSSMQKTNKNGDASFLKLVPGMYLVLIESADVGNYRYSVSPMLVSIPILENKSYQYDIQMNVKVEREKLEQEVTSPSDVNDEDEIDTAPNTVDNIMIYVLLMVVSTLVIFVVIIYILRMREGEKNDEKK